MNPYSILRRAACLLLVTVSAFAQDKPASPPYAPNSTQDPSVQPSQQPSQVESQQPGSRQTSAKQYPPAKPVKIYNDGSLRDINAIGNRKVGCDRGIGNWYSLEKQIAMGWQYSQQVESTSKLVTDPIITEYVNRVGQNIVRNSDAQVPFVIKVVDTDDINAFALPGGFFYVDSGLILAADNEAELAGVMSHEIAHVAACHMARQNTRGKMMHMASIPLMMLGGPIGYAGYEALT